MAKIIKGFITDIDFISNASGVVSSVFELSDKGLSYSKDKTYYSVPTSPNNDLIVFKSYDNISGDRYILDNSLVTTTMAICQLIKNYPSNHLYPYNKVDYIDHIQATIGNGIVNVNIGDFESYNGVYYPKWFSYTTTDADPKNVKIYISNIEFLNSYDEYEIIVVPPLADTTNFNGYYTTAIDLLDEVTYESFNNRIEEAKEDFPNTYTKVLEFDFYNKNNITESRKTYWGIVIYGEAGNDIDLIKDAIEAYVLSNPANTRTHWEVIFPDIFRRTEFMLLPLWHKVAVHNLTDLSNLYASMLGIKEIKDFVFGEYNDIYDEMFIYNNLVIFPYDYKAISIAAMPGALNLEDRDQLFEIFDDYLPINTSSMDFMRMKVLTRDWCIKLEQALLLAETEDMYASLPSGFRKVIRGTRYYVGFYYNNINYLVAYSYNGFYNP